MKKFHKISCLLITLLMAIAGLFTFPLHVTATYDEGWLWPVKGTREISSAMQENRYLNGKIRDHTGIDIPGSSKTDRMVVTTRSGTVKICHNKDDNARGIYVIIEHEVNEKIMYSAYLHLKPDSIKITEGQQVKQGDQVILEILRLVEKQCNTCAGFLAGPRQVADNPAQIAGSVARCSV